MALTPFHVAVQVRDIPEARAFYGGVLGVPVPHCGVVLETRDWTALAQRLRQHPVEWVIEPCTRFAGAPGEQSTLFVLDPTGNALEFKSFRDIAGELFAK
jgi:extradiol dioxygenase family protein